MRNYFTLAFAMPLLLYIREIKTPEQDKLLDQS